jgi:MraZ protein
VQAELPRFAGSELHALDDKGRLIVPARFRERLGSNFVLTIAHPDPCLALYPSVTWNQFCQRLEEAPRKDDRFRRIVRYLFANTEEVGFDNQGRVGIPTPLRAYAGIERQVVSVGLLTRIEIWAKERYVVGAQPEDEVGGFLTDLGLY